MASQSASKQEAWEGLNKLLTEQLVGVLGTFDGQTPYTSIVAFAAVSDFRELIFATPRATRKFANLQTCPRASLLIDNRQNSTDDFHAAMAVTARGEISVFDTDERLDAMACFLNRHPYLEDFVTSPSSAMIAITVHDYVIVRRFQDVTEIVMGEDDAADAH